jgi:hypothetical protein
MVMTDQLLARIEEILWPENPRKNVWMILDGARSIEIFRMLLACHLEYACLYSGPLTPELEMAAPYLVQLDHGYKDTHQFIRRAWGNSWGVFSKERDLTQETKASPAGVFDRSGYQGKPPDFPVLRSARIASVFADVHPV